MKRYATLLSLSLTLMAGFIPELLFGQKAISPEQFLRSTNNKSHYSDLTAKKAIRSIHKKLVAGVLFDTLARHYSQDYGSYAVGGDLGWQILDRFVPGFKENVASLNKGELSRPFKTEFGYHIVQVLDRNEDKIRSRHILLRVTD